MIWHNRITGVSAKYTKRNKWVKKLYSSSLKRMLKRYFSYLKSSLKKKPETKMKKMKMNDQEFLDADFSNIMYEKYGEKWKEQQKKEIKRIQEENLVSIDNVIFEPMPKRKNEKE